MTREEQIKEAAKQYCEKFPRGKTASFVSFRAGVEWNEQNQSSVDWRQVRIQAAIAAMQLIQTDEIFKRWVQERVDEGGVYYEEYPNIAVEIADHLIVALKQEPWILKENDIKL